MKVQSDLKPNILIVEDDHVSLFVLNKMLESKFSVHCAANSNEAFEKVKNNAIDLILMDINLGEESLNGAELMKHIRKKPAYAKIPVFAITSYAMAEDRTNFLEQGFDQFLAKPVKKSELFHAIEQVLPK